MDRRGLILSAPIGALPVIFLDLLYVFATSYRRAELLPLVVPLIQKILDTIGVTGGIPTTISSWRIYAFQYLSMTLTGLEVGVNTPFGRFWFPIRRSLWPGSLFHLLLLLLGGMLSAWFYTKYAGYYGSELGECAVSGAAIALPFTASVMLIGFPSTISFSIEPGVELYLGIYRVGIFVSFFVALVFGAIGGVLYKFMSERGVFHGAY